MVSSRKKRKRFFSEGDFLNSVTYPNTSKNDVLNQGKIRLTRCKLEEKKKTFFQCNKPGNHTTLRQTNQNIFFVQKAWYNVFWPRKKNGVFCDIKLKEAQFNCKLNKRYFRCYEAQSSVFSNDKLNGCFL